MGLEIASDLDRCAAGALKPGAAGVGNQMKRNGAYIDCSWSTLHKSCFRFAHLPGSESDQGVVK